MNHTMIDGYHGYRSRLDDTRLVQEILEEVPLKLDLQPVMPAFLLPYYNGAVPEDCGISAFIFLQGGHLTVHTFSFRETYFADLLAPEGYDARHFHALLRAALPATKVTMNRVARERARPSDPDMDPEVDFGPHLLVGIDGYEGPQTLDDLFTLFDRLPAEIGMTPIMRPYVIRTRDAGGGEVLSAMTMIAESHVAIHVFTERRKAYFDLFSCSFFDPDEVLPPLRAELKGRRRREILISRGKHHRLLRTERDEELARSQVWLRAVLPAGPGGDDPR